MSKREIAFALSLITTITLPIFLLLSVWPCGIFIAFFLIGLIMSIMIAVSVSMRKSKISKIKRVIGGTIILIMGIVIGVIGMLDFFLSAGEIEVRYLFLIPAAMATVGGCLGIAGAREGEVKREYSKRFVFRISLMGFISALVSVFAFFWAILSIIIVERLLPRAILLSMFSVTTFPWTISIIFNAINTVVIGRKEIVSEEKTKRLIIVTWYIIAFLLIGLFLLFFKTAVMIVMH